MTTNFKKKRWQSKKYRDGARGQPCTLRLPCCNHNPETTVLAHEGGAGMALKADDYNGADCCSACHDSLDGRTKWLPEYGDKKEEFARARYETIINRLERGIVK